MRRSWSSRLIPSAVLAVGLLGIGPCAAGAQPQYDTGQDTDRGYTNQRAQYNGGSWGLLGLLGLLGLFGAPRTRKESGRKMEGTFEPRTRR
jgi:hypothetical protein